MCSSQIIDRDNGTFDPIGTKQLLSPVDRAEDGLVDGRQVGDHAWGHHIIKHPVTVRRCQDPVHDQVPSLQASDASIVCQNFPK